MTKTQGIVAKGSAYLLWLLLCPTIAMVPAHPLPPLVVSAFLQARASGSELCIRPLTVITSQMLIPPVWGRDEREGRPEAALVPWVTDLKEWSPEMPDKPPVSPLARPDGSRSAGLMNLSQGQLCLNWALPMESWAGMTSRLRARRESQT